MDEQHALEFAAARGFGVVVAADEQGPRASHVPFVLKTDDRGTLAQFHLTARNPLIALADGTRRFLLIVAGADAYVSNDWYESADNVSTWLYEAVHLGGIAYARELDQNRAHGDALLAASEARLEKEPWRLSAMQPSKREAMLASIRVVDIVVDQVEGQSKLNQHKPDADHVAIADQLAHAPDTAAQCLAVKMRALRPHLTYGALSSDKQERSRHPPASRPADSDG
jgi:transcriptional regulator